MATAQASHNGAKHSILAPISSLSSLSLTSQSPSTSPHDPAGPELIHYSAPEMAMFEKIIATRCSIKSQQRGEPDLSKPELCNVLYTTMCQKPGAFLMRFGRYLDITDLNYFDGRFKGDFEVNFRINELRRNLKRSNKARMKTVKNRRYKCLKGLMAESDYFSEEEMRQRNPLLFEYYIGQFMSEDEKFKVEGNLSDMKLSSMILKNMEVDRRMKLLKEQQRREADQMEESDSSADEDETSNEDKDLHLPPMSLSSDPDTAGKEKLLLSREFLVAMQASFLDGRDKDFDYSKIDNDERYDSLEIVGKDAEDDYFDSEDPSWCEVDVHSNSSTEIELGITGEKDHMNDDEVGDCEFATTVCEPPGR